MDQYNEIYEKTLEVWGEKSQYDQAVEECAELIVTLKHYIRGKTDTTSVIDELADVYLMLGQLIYMFGEQDVQRVISKKAESLKTLLDELDT
jgi:NTP pyrophosphatase (non-canonical NTP hydrolase)